jgi:hypothetical protein
MKFPKHNIQRADLDHPFFQELHQKRIGFSPLVFCEFFQGMEVLQIYGEESKEYFFAIYFSGNLIGHIYLGDTFSDEDLATIKDKYFPPTWDQIYEYVKTTSGVWYHKCEPSQYAFVLQEPNIVKKII